MLGKEQTGDGRKRFTSKSIVLAPGEARQLAVGSYFMSDREPQFDVHYEPHIHEDIGATLERQDVLGTAKYVMFYLFHNYGEKACTITVERRENDRSD